MVAPIGRLPKSNKMDIGIFQNYFRKTIDKLEYSKYDVVKINQ